MIHDPSHDERPKLGILMLDSRFPRFLGDVGNPETWSFPVLYEKVQKASPDKIVNGTSLDMLPSFIKAGLALERTGVAGIATSCGFLSLMQEPLKKALSVPLLTSSLAQAPLVQSSLPANKQVGILTINAENLSPDHLSAAGADPKTPVWGMPADTDFRSHILSDKPSLDYDKSAQELCRAALDFKGSCHTLGALILECTNMAPYAKVISKAIGLPVYSVVTLIHWFYQGLCPPTWLKA